MLLTGCGRGRLEPESHPGEMVWHAETVRIRGFDPARISDVASALAVQKVYEGLLQYAYLDRPYHVEPLLAAAMPQISPDGLTYLFPVRRGLFFQDDPCFTATGGRGRELTAADFVYAIRRVMDLKIASPGAWAFTDRIVGLDAWRATTGGDQPSDYDRPIAGLDAPDRYTLRLQLKRADPRLLWILTLPYGVALPREAVSFYGREFANHPVGTGPFILKACRPNYRYEFIRNPQWQKTGRVDRFPASNDPSDPPALRADAGRPLPFLDRIVQYVVEDATTAWLMFLTGQLDTVGGNEARSLSRDTLSAVFDQAQQLQPSLAHQGLAVSSAPMMQIVYAGFNMDDPVVGPNRKLRQALSHAFDEAAYIRFFNRRITRPAGPIPPAVAGYAPRPQPYPVALIRARLPLAEAGYPGGRDPQTGRRLQLTLEVGSAENPEHRQATELICAFMNQLGVSIAPSYNNWPAFMAKLERRQAQLFLTSWVADYPDAENFLQLFYSPNASPGCNRSNYSNPAFDRLYEQARVLPDGPTRTALYQRMADLVVADCPWINISMPLDFVLRHAWVGNYKYHDFPYGMMKYYKIERTAAR
ncbi:MAG: ABC transporter substrate-binding protein [Kiritimatiellaeota bacterium]|nr:ABC transporter substrate-binding protein [Kiritimatiellota bacterium]